MDLSDEVKALLNAKPGSIVPLPTAPVDLRFGSTTDQFKYCYVAYNTYLASLKKNGIDHEKTAYYRHQSGIMCPAELLKKWYEARRDDLWFGYQGAPMTEEELEDGDEVIQRPKHEAHGHH